MRFVKNHSLQWPSLFFFPRAPRYYIRHMFRPGGHSNTRPSVLNPQASLLLISWPQRDENLPSRTLDLQRESQTCCQLRHWALVNYCCILKFFHQIINLFSLLRAQSTQRIIVDIFLLYIFVPPPLFALSNTEPVFMNFFYYSRINGQG